MFLLFLFKIKYNILYPSNLFWISFWNTGLNCSNPTFKTSLLALFCLQLVVKPIKPYIIISLKADDFNKTTTVAMVRICQDTPLYIELFMSLTTKCLGETLILSVCWSVGLSVGCRFVCLNKETSFWLNLVQSVWGKKIEWKKDGQK